MVRFINRVGYTPAVFERFTLSDGSGVWRSSLLAGAGVEHAFTTRSHNVASASDVEALLTNPELFVDRGGPEVLMSKQVHGNRVSRPGDRMAEADGHVADRPHAAAAVRTADCVPILLSVRSGHAIAAVHAGWRGLDPACGVVAAAVEALLEDAAPTTAMRRGVVAAVGPCIGAARYEVGPEVAEKFQAAHPEALSPGAGDRVHLDLRRVARAQLRASGVAQGCIDVYPGCTYDQADEFYSYRREGPGVGHQAAVAAPRPG